MNGRHKTKHAGPSPLRLGGREGKVMKKRGKRETEAQKVYFYD